MSLVWAVIAALAAVVALRCSSQAYWACHASQRAAERAEAAAERAEAAVKAARGSH